MRPRGDNNDRANATWQMMHESSSARRVISSRCSIANFDAGGFPRCRFASNARRTKSETKASVERCENARWMICSNGVNGGRPSPPLSVCALFCVEGGCPPTSVLRGIWSVVENIRVPRSRKGGAAGRYVGAAPSQPLSRWASCTGGAACMKPGPDRSVNAGCPAERNGTRTRNGWCTPPVNAFGTDGADPGGGALPGIAGVGIPGLPEVGSIDPSRNGGI